MYLISYLKQLVLFSLLILVESSYWSSDWPTDWPNPLCPACSKYKRKISLSLGFWLVDDSTAWFLICWWFQGLVSDWLMTLRLGFWLVDESKARFLIGWWLQGLVSDWLMTLRPGFWLVDYFTTHHCTVTVLPRTPPCLHWVIYFSARLLTPDSHSFCFLFLCFPQGSLLKAYLWIL